MDERTRPRSMTLWIAGALTLLALLFTLMLSPAAEASVSYGDGSSCGSTAYDSPCEITSPGLPKWLTFAGSGAYLATQTENGELADEFGATKSTDPTILAAGARYTKAPALDSSTIKATVLSPLDASAYDDSDATVEATGDPGATDAVLATGTGTIRIDGPQSSGFKNITTATLPSGDTITGISALAAPVGSGQPGLVIALTSKGQYVVYDYKNGKLTGGKLLSSITASGSVSGATDGAANGDRALAIYQPSASEDLYETATGAAGQATFAVATLDPSDSCYRSGETAPCYTVSIFAYNAADNKDDGTIDAGELSWVGGVDLSLPDGAANSGSFPDLKLQYEIEAQNQLGEDTEYDIVHLATVSDNGTTSPAPELQSTDFAIAVGSSNTEWFARNNGAAKDVDWDTQNAGGDGGKVGLAYPCPVPRAGGLPTLASDAAFNVDAAGSDGYPGLGSSGSACVALTGADAVKATYVREDDMGYEDGDGNRTSDGDEEYIPSMLNWGEYTAAPKVEGEAKAPDVTSLGASVEFPCREGLGLLAGDGAETPNSSNYCSDASDPDYNASSPEGYDPTSVHGATCGGDGSGAQCEFSPAGSMAIDFEELNAATAKPSLDLESVAFPMPTCITPGGMEGGGSSSADSQLECTYVPSLTPVSDSSTPTGAEQADTDTEVQTAVAVPASKQLRLTMVPYEQQPTIDKLQYLTNNDGSLYETGNASSGPVPVALLAAPPYYAPGLQGMTPTSVTYGADSCNGSSSTTSNDVGVSMGLDFQGSVLGFPDTEYEVKAMAGFDASWENESDFSACNDNSISYQGGTSPQNSASENSAANSVVFQVQNGDMTYAKLTGESGGIGLTPDCTLKDLSACDEIFAPNGTTEYDVQTIDQIKHPSPASSLASDDHTLNNDFGSGLTKLFPTAGSPASYASDGNGTMTTLPSGTDCTNPDSGGLGTGYPGLLDDNEFNDAASALPADEQPPDFLLGDSSQVTPASGSTESGTTSSLEYTTENSNTSSSTYAVTASLETTIGLFAASANYSHGIGSGSSQSFSKNTSFEGGVDDFDGGYNPYRYQLYECVANLPVQGEQDPVFYVGYLASQIPSNTQITMPKAWTPEATIGQSYSGVLYATGGVPAYKYKLAKGSKLPAGLTLDAGIGDISGSPTRARKYKFTVQVADSNNATASQKETLTVTKAISDKAVLPNAVINKSYSGSLDIAGGIRPYTEVPVVSSEDGLSISDTGKISGKPKQAGTYCFSTYVTDSNVPPSSATVKSCVSVDPAPAAKSVAFGDHKLTLSVPPAKGCEAPGGPADVYLTLTESKAGATTTLTGVTFKIDGETAGDLKSLKAGKKVEKSLSLMKVKRGGDHLQLKIAYSEVKKVKGRSKKLKETKSVSFPFAVCAS